MTKNEVEFSSEINVQLVRVLADDATVVSAARVSTQGEEILGYATAPEANEGLIKFLMRNRHGTPFEHNQFTFFVEAPIFVFREFHRHRIGWSYNEESGRYKELRGKFYVPDEERNLTQSGKPGHYIFEPGTEEQHDVMRAVQKNSCQTAYYAYQMQLNRGVAKEVARMCLPVSTYSTMYATCNSRSLMSFLSLRQRHPMAKFPSSPMHEINVVADVMEESFAAFMPITHAAFVENGYVAP
jgi:thymidylate synthase (FAD)